MLLIILYYILLYYIILDYLKSYDMIWYDIMFI